MFQPNRGWGNGPKNQTPNKINVEDEKKCVRLQQNDGGYGGGTEGVEKLLNNENNGLRPVNRPGWMGDEVP